MGVWYEFKIYILFKPRGFSLAHNITQKTDKSLQFKLHVSRLLVSASFLFKTVITNLVIYITWYVTVFLRAQQDLIIGIFCFQPDLLRSLIIEDVTPISSPGGSQFPGYIAAMKALHLEGSNLGEMRRSAMLQLERDIPVSLHLLHDKPTLYLVVSLALCLEVG